MKQIIIFLGVTLTFAFLVLSCGKEKEKYTSDSISNDSLVSRGKYLVAVTGCADCHTPKVMTPMGPVLDTLLLFSGHRSDAKPLELSKDAFEKGWVLFNTENTMLATSGFTSYAANITSDDTGIGTWSYEQFKIALTKGKWKGLEGSRDLLPPMPWQNYAKMSDEDLQAIFAFLKSTKPVENVVPATVLSNNN